MDTNTNKNNNTRRPSSNPQAGFRAPANRPSFNKPKGSGTPSKRPSYNRPARPSRKSTAPEFESRLSESETTHIPPLKNGDVRIIHLGGVEEVGRNMSMIEYKDSIVIIDCGVQFTETHTPGIDFILPNTAYLEERKDKIKAMLVTHGHLDHIGAIPYIMPRIGNPTIYSRNFTALMIRKRQEEFPFLDPLKINIVEKGDTITLGDLKVTFFGVTHAIPDSMGIMVETPYGNIVHTGDLRLEHNDNVPTKEEEDRYKVFENTKTLLLMSDSTNCENPGFSISDQVVYNNVEKVIRDTKGRLIVSTFASQVERMLFMLECAEKYNKKVVIEGRSMKTNVEVAKLANMLKIKDGTIIDLEEMHNYPESQIIVMATGAQGEEFAALGRIAHKTHKFIKLSERDTILMSSSVVPGNERAVQNLKDKLSRQGAHLIHYKTSDVHSSGHANSDELAWIHRKIQPKFFVPVHGYHYMLRVHADLARKSLALAPGNYLVPDNGLVIEIQNEGQKLTQLDVRCPNDLIVVDGTNVGKVQEVVLRDRQLLTDSGIFMIIGIIDAKTRTLKKSPDIISRGFVYLKESQELLFSARTLCKTTIENYLAKHTYVELEDLRNEVGDEISKFLTQKTAKKPVIIPVMITI